MTKHAHKNAALSALALNMLSGAALGWAAPAQAAGDTLLQLDGVPGESKATAAWAQGLDPRSRGGQLRHRLGQFQFHQD
jgi:hypothetical protein